MNKRLLLLMATVLNIPFSTMAASFEQLAMDKSNPQVIDCRASEFYNGWPEQGEKVGGHIPGAANFSASWLPMLSDEAISQQLNMRGLIADKATYLYGCPESQNELKNKLAQLGFKNVQTIEQPVSEYSKKLVALDNYEQLVSASWLANLISGKDVVAQPAGGFKVVAVAWGPPTKHLVSHVPGALYLNTNLLETEENNWNRVSADKLKSLLEEMGIRHDTTVILYDRNTIAAFRAANLFMYAGVKDVRVLDGGWSAWNQNGNPTEPLMNDEASPVDFGIDVPAKPEYAIDIPEAKQLLVDPEKSSLVSIRSWDEFTGTTSGYSYIEKAGRIKGSRWGHAGSDPYHMEDFHNPDGTMLSADLISKNWSEWGIHESQNVAFFCGTGWRASEAFFYAHVMGWKSVSVFDGGWYEWSMDDANPVEVGEPR